MANELTTQSPRDVAPPNPGRDVVAHNPFGGRNDRKNINEGAVAIESDRAVAEAQAAFVVAQRFPRDEMQCYEKFMAACSRPSFAARAFYKYSRGGSNVEGPSIRFAEEGARCWRNFIYGMFELSNKDGATEMQAFAHDLESNVRSPQNFTVRWIRDKNSGGNTALTSERDIYEIGANMGSRRMRARILALLPADYVEDGIARCKETLAKADSGVPLPERIKAMVNAFAKAGVTVAMLATRLGHPVDATAPGELDDLRGVLTAIKEGVTTAAEEFSGAGTGAAVAGLAAKGRATEAAKATAAEQAGKAAQAAPAPKEDAAAPEVEPEATAQIAEPANDAPALAESAVAESEPEDDMF